MRNSFVLAVVLACIASAAYAEPPRDFTVPAVAPPFKLSEARGSFVALHFLLKTECPFCMRLTHEYTARAGEVPGVIHVFLKPDEPAQIMKWLADTKFSPATTRPTIYQDAGGKLADQYQIPGGYKFHGTVTHYPALIILDREGREAFRYVGKNNTDRYPFDQFAARIAELSARSESPAATSK